MREEISNWWKQAQRDIVTAENSLKSGDYYASVFWCQQSIEKGLKAYIMNSQKISSRQLNIHSLIKLARYAHVPNEYHQFLKNVSVEYYMARYPDASDEAPYKLYTKEDSQEIVNKSKKFMQWLDIQMKK